MLTSILIDLAEVSVNVGSWTWNRGNTQLCFRCWTTWHGFSERLYPGKRSSTCPSCIFIANVLRCEGVAEDNCYAIPCEEREHFASPRTISWYARGRAPRFLKFYSRNRNDTFTWISYENNEVHRRRLADPESAHTFDIPDQANRLLLRSWMDECDTHRHSRAVDMGGNGRRQRVYNILLVDVRQKMLVGSRLLPEEKMPRYLALSYVWGSTHFFKTTKSKLASLLLPGGLAAPHVSLPQTFLDAMQLVDLIGERYIWIDALCIVQDDQRKHNQLQIMDQIYGRAYMTIVCLAGDSAHFGLPGVSANTRIRRPWTCQFDQEALYEGLPSLQEAITGSTHYTRAWTYQETMLSMRCLFISEGQFFFRCSRSHHAESIDWRAEIQPIKAAELGLIASATTYWHEDIFFNSVEHYTRRTLSFDEDIVHAFSGALERMKQMGHRPRGDRTMDLLSPDSLIWFSVDRTAVRRLNHLEPYPTWSWTGWIGAITYLSRRFSDLTAASTSLRWSQRFRSANTNLFYSLERRENSDGHEPLPVCRRRYCSQVLHFERDRSQSTDKPYPHFPHLSLYRFCTSVCSVSNFASYGLTFYMDKYSGPPIDVAFRGIFDREGRKCGYFFNPPEIDPLLWSPENGVPKYLLIAVSMKKQDGIYLMQKEIDVRGRERPCICWLNIMLVKKSEEHEGLVERIAVGQMRPRAWAKANPTIETVTMM
jgi:hypothetical protein